MMTPVIEPEFASENDTVASVMPVLMFGSVGFGNSATFAGADG